MEHTETKSFKVINKESIEKQYFENHPSLLLDLIIWVIKMILFSALIFYFGYVYGFFSYLVAIYSYRMIIRFMFRFENTSMTDKLFINKDICNNINIGSVISLESVNKTEIKEIIKTKLFDKTDKLYSNLVYFMGDYYWNTPQVKSFSKNQKTKIFEKRISEITLKKENVKKFLEERVNSFINPFIDPFEVFIIEFENENKNKKDITDDCNGILFLNLNHTFSDGLGMLSTMQFLDSNFSKDKLPSIMTKSFGILYYFKFVYDTLFAFMYGILELILFLAYFCSKIKYKEFEKNEFLSNDCKISDTTTIDLHHAKKFCKDKKISINDFLVYSLFKTLKSYSPESDYVSFIIPVGFPNLTDKAEDLIINNSFLPYLDVLNLPQKELKKFDLVKLVDNLYKLRSQQIAYIFCDFFAPLFMFKVIQNRSFPEFLITNVPGYTKEIRIGSCKVTNITPITSLGNFKMFIAICSYCEKLNIVSSVNKQSKFDLEKFNNLFSNIIGNYV